MPGDKELISSDVRVQFEVDDANANLEDNLSDDDVAKDHDFQKPVKRTAYAVGMKLEAVQLAKKCPMPQQQANFALLAHELSSGVVRSINCNH